MAIERDDKGRIKKGSGCLNPGGRPKKSDDIKQLIMDKTKDLDKVFKTIMAIMNDKKSSNKDRIASARVLLEYSLGKPAQQITANIDTTGDLTFRWAVSEEEAK